MSYTIAKGSLFPCHQHGCFNKVRLFKDLHLNNLADFKCASCMDLKGYSYCSECDGMCITDTIYCFVCEEDYPSIFTQVPIAPQPSIKPSVCQYFDCDNTDIKWTYNPFDYEMNNEYIYGWWCEECLELYAMCT